MSPDAKRRMDVYQEGQRAFNSGAACLYTDWRAGTWLKGYDAAEAYANTFTEVTPDENLEGEPRELRLGELYDTLNQLRDLERGIASKENQLSRMEDGSGDLPAVARLRERIQADKTERIRLREQVIGE